MWPEYHWDREILEAHFIIIKQLHNYYELNYETENHRRHEKMTMDLPMMNYEKEIQRALLCLQINRGKHFHYLVLRFFWLAFSYLAALLFLFDSQKMLTKYNRMNSFGGVFYYSFSPPPLSPRHTSYFDTTNKVTKISTFRSQKQAKKVAENGRNLSFW